MKVEKKKEELGFKPVTVEITFETQQELNDIYACLVYNYSLPKVVNTESRENFKEFIDEVRDTISNYYRSE